MKEDCYLYVFTDSSNFTQVSQFDYTLKEVEAALVAQIKLRAEKSLSPIILAFAVSKDG